MRLTRRGVLTCGAAAAGGVAGAGALVATVPSLDRGTAQQLVDAAHERCPYSKATRGNIDVTVALA